MRSAARCSRRPASVAIAGLARANSRLWPRSRAAAPSMIRPRPMSRRSSFPARDV
jgi:hypothetical protein